MNIKVHVHMDKEDMFNAGIEAGLSEEAANYFEYFNELILTLEVDELTGSVKEVIIPKT